MSASVPTWAMQHCNQGGQHEHTSHSNDHGGKVHYDGAKNEECEVIIYGMGPGTSTRVGEN
jgi:hypothetical protein